MQNLDCQKCQDLLNAQWDGDDLAQEQLDLVQAHCADCQECREFSATGELLLGTASAMSDVSYQRSIELAPLVIASRGRSLVPSWALFASAVTASVLVGVLLGNFFQPNFSQPNFSQPKGSSAPDTEEASMLVRFAVPMANAKSVEVVGDFTGWNNRLPLQPVSNDLWVGQVKVKTGRYKYVIVIDGDKLQADPAAQQIVDDGFGGQNSVLYVGRDVPTGI